jgi:hypothetical protein
MKNAQVTTHRKVGRPPQNGMEFPYMLLRRMHAVRKYKQLRAAGVKFEVAVDETRSYLKEKFDLKKASDAMVKTILAETIPRDADEEWNVEITFDPATGKECGALSFVPKKNYIRSNSLSLKSNNQ